MRRFRKTAVPGAALVAAVASLLLTRAGAAPGAPPVAGGAVPSSLTLSLSGPSDFTRVGGRGRSGVFRTTIRAVVTATVTPTWLSLGTDEADEPLRRWRRPVSRAAVKIRLDRVARNGRAARNSRGVAMITLAAGGP